MRENTGLFKAKRIDNCDWVQGYYFNYIDIDKDFKNVHYHLILDNKVREQYEVDHETICEFTGLKNLYEHDFIRFANGAKYEIIWEDFMFKIANETHREALFESEDYDWQIIGNRFD